MNPGVFLFSLLHQYQKIHSTTNKISYHLQQLSQLCPMTNIPQCPANMLPSPYPLFQPQPQYKLCNSVPLPCLNGWLDPQGSWYHFFVSAHHIEDVLVAASRSLVQALFVLSRYLLGAISIRLLLLRSQVRIIFPFINF